MERFPYSELMVGIAPAPGTVDGHWRRNPPVLRGRSITLRELRHSDAITLFSMLAAEEVSRFISPPPPTIEGFERFVDWTHREREAGNYICFGIVPDGLNDAVGIIQVRKIDPGFLTAEWGFALGSPFWGSGAFEQAAALVLDFVFDVIGVHRLEARAAVRNGRGNGALKKVGAVQEGILRRSLLRDGEYHDQVLWAIIDSDRRATRGFSGPRVH